MRYTILLIAIVFVFPERYLFGAWSDSIDQVFEVMGGVVGVNGIPK